MKRLNGGNVGVDSLSDLAINRDFDTTVRSRRGILLYGEDDGEDENERGGAPEQRAAPWQRSGKEEGTISAI